MKEDSGPDHHPWLEATMNPPFISRTTLLLIPRPSRAGGNIQDHLRLRSDKPTYNKLRDDTRRLIRRYLTKHCTFRSEVGKPTAVWREFEADAVKLYDQFRLYEGLWIVEDLVQEILQNHFGDDNDADEVERRVLSAKVDSIGWRWETFGAGSVDVSLQDMQTISQASRECPRSIKMFDAVIIGTLMRGAAELANTSPRVPAKGPPESCSPWCPDSDISLDSVALKTLLEVFDAIGDIKPPYAATCQLFDHFLANRPSNCMSRLLVVQVYLRLAQLPSMNPMHRIGFLTDCAAISGATCLPFQYKDSILLSIQTLEVQLRGAHAETLAALRRWVISLTP